MSSGNINKLSREAKAKQLKLFKKKLKKLLTKINTCVNINTVRERNTRNENDERKKFKKVVKKHLTFWSSSCIIKKFASGKRMRGRIAQLGEHLPYKQGVIGSSPITPTIKDGLVVQLVRMPACHAGGRRFEPVPGRQLF